MSRHAASAAVDELGEALVQAQAALVSGSRFRPWLARIRTELLDLRGQLERPGSGTPIADAQLAWLESRQRELRRELPPRQLLPVPASPAVVALRRAGSLARRASRAAHRERADPDVAAYLACLGRLLVLLARVVDGDPRASLRTTEDLPDERSFRTGLASG